jgi:hypothetical protein
VYNVHATRPLQVNPVARWSSKNGITWSEVFFLERRDLQGITLKAAVINEVCKEFLVWWKIDVAI